MFIATSIKDRENSNIEAVSEDDDSNKPDLHFFTIAIDKIYNHVQVHQNFF